MPKRRYLTLAASQRVELEQLLHRDPRPYMRERASALLQVADGRSSHWVALNGLLRRRKPDTVIGWLNAYEQGGVSALVHRPRRRRHFSPSAGR
jgi:hypothetical protein